MGIAEAALEQLFAPFVRLQAAASGIEGSGLGLALSKSLIESMGGRVGVRSKVGIGSTFSIELRTASALAITEPASGASELMVEHRYATTRRLLYIEDTPTNIRFVEAVLQRRPSVELIPAMMGRLGLELAREHRPDLILLDLHLPDMTGEEVLTQLRDDPQTQEIPVVVLSADATDAARTPMIQAEAQGFMTKPIGVKALLGLVDQFAGDRRAGAAP
jgi:CheY-like chemotaxis protein